MNASNIPLNDEEQRNARFQGPFKWFIQRIAKEFSSILAGLGLFSNRDMIRMIDTKTYAEIVHTAINGFLTTKGPQLDSLYRQFNTSFVEEDAYHEQLSSTLEEFLARPELHEKILLRPHVFQSICLVLLDRKFDRGLRENAAALIPDFVQELPQGGYELTDLVEALREPDEFPQLAKFTDSVSKGTNVGTAKAARFLYLDSVM